MEETLVVKDSFKLKESVKVVKGDDVPHIKTRNDNDSSTKWITMTRDLDIDIPFPGPTRDIVKYMCAKCGYEVSERSTFCPGCGLPAKK